jgi:hypothetical protein
MDGLGISDDVDGTFAKSVFNFCICAPTSRFPNPKLLKLERGDLVATCCIIIIYLFIYLNRIE